MGRDQRKRISRTNERALQSQQQKADATAKAIGNHERLPFGGNVHIHRLHQRGPKILGHRLPASALGQDWNHAKLHELMYPRVPETREISESLKLKILNGVPGIRQLGGGGRDTRAKFTDPEWFKSSKPWK